MFTIRTRAAFVVVLSSVIVCACVIWLQQNSVYKFPNELQKFLMYDELPVDEVIGVNALKLKIKEINVKLEVRNWRKFGPLVKKTTIVTIQVHKNIRALQYLIISLAQVRYIESVLLVFSHSYYSDCINRLIRRIDFCKVMQIFFPHSVQLHPNNFPGIDPEECIDGSQTTLQQCQQRDANLIERKHHWWWKANFIFGQMKWSRDYAGMVIFLEEDQYVSPDLLHMLQYVQRSLSHFPDAEVMSFGTIYTRNLDSHLITLEYWRPPFDVGIAFNRSTWNKILDLSSFYCMYDDCSWSYSLLNVFKNFPKGDVDMVACVAPRVIAMKQFTNVEHAAVQLSRAFSNLGLYPEKVHATYLFGPNGRLKINMTAPPRGNGGWMNIKDQLLCLAPLSLTTDEYEETTITSTSKQYTHRKAVSQY